MEFNNLNLNGEGHYEFCVRAMDAECELVFNNFQVSGAGSFRRHRDITINYQLEVLPGDRLIVPGCEPTSALSSVKLSASLAISGCGNAIIELQDALDAIEGSYVKIGLNFNKHNVRTKWYVLPPITVDCPCESYDDYYDMLKELTDPNLSTTQEFDPCEKFSALASMGFCPSPGFEDIPEPPPSPYISEGEFPPVGILPPVPPQAL